MATGGLRRSQWMNGWRFAWHGVHASAPEVGADSQSPNADWSFGDPRRPRVAWDLPPPSAVPPLGVEKILAATADQVAYALVEGEQELLPYRRLTVKPLIAVRVPTETGLGFILFDSRDGTVAERRGYVLRQMPPTRSWFGLGQYQAVYLGTAKPEAGPAPPEPAKASPGAL